MLVKATQKNKLPKLMTQKAVISVKKKAETLIEALTLVK
jgi:hypothetical protein